MSSLKPFIFIHIPRTGGTTFLRFILPRLYRAKSIFKIYNSKNYDYSGEMKQVTEEKAANTKVYGGHMKFGSHRFPFTPSVYTTLFREPTYRVISNFLLLKHGLKPKQQDTIIQKNISLSEAIEQGVSIDLNNLQTRLLTDKGINVGYGQCTNDLLEEAKENLVNYFPVFGLTEYFYESQLLLGKHFKWPFPFFETKNKNPHLTKENYEKKYRDVIPAIRKYNALDQKLYAFAHELFFQKLKEYQVTKRKAWVFKSLNKLYKFKGVRKLGNLFLNR